MKWLSLFVDSEYELRSGWKVAGYSVLLVVLFIAAGTVIGTAALQLDPGLSGLSETDMRRVALNTLVLAVPSIGALAVMARFVDRAPWATFGVAFHDRWQRDFGMGLAVAGGMLGIMLGGAFVFGSVRMEWGTVWGMEWVGFGAAFSPIVATLLVLGLAAANEELVFRGYPLQVLIKGVGPGGAVFLVSSVFGLLHARNSGATVMSVLNTILAGMLLSQAYLKTRSLWFPYGIHIGWNAGLSTVLGVPLSGFKTPSMLTTEMSGSAALLGGSYGPEGGLLGTFVFLAGAVIVYRMRALGISSQIRAALTPRALATSREGL